MARILFLLLVLAPVQYNSLPHCQTSRPTTSLGVLPGGGWDNLRNIDMGRVMNFSYLRCQTTEDGFYLIPDEVFVIPQKETRVETTTEIISSWMEQKSVTSRSINVEGSFIPLLNGKFSAENQRMKIKQVENSALTARVQVRNFLYTVKAYPDFTLDSRFVQQAKDIADAIENNQTKNADYLSEKMVVDYGTHVITSVDAGASLVEEDYLSSKYITDNQLVKSEVEIAAGIHFFNLVKFDELKFQIGVKSIDQNSSIENYQSNKKDSDIESHGGVPFYPGITLQKWQERIKNNLVAIDRSGVPLHHLIDHNTLPDLPQPTVKKVSESVEKAIQRYYEVNTRPGCVDVNSENFNFQANVDDSSCEGPATNLSFGGVYQKCTQLSPDAGPLCDKLTQKNPDTGDFSCRSPYTPTLLRSEVRQEEYSPNECHDKQIPCGFFYMYYCNKTICETHHYNRSAEIQTYWCSRTGKAPADSGYLFGGLSTKDCPSSFVAVTFLSDGIVLCLSDDYERNSRFAVPFGGFFSCESTNPLANNQSRCPPKFSQHVAAVSDDCEIRYCVQSKSFTERDLQPVILPPFTKYSLHKKMDSENTELTNWGKTAVVFGVLALVTLMVVVAASFFKKGNYRRFQ